MAHTENDKKADKKEKPSTKVIVRRLPPTIDKETFLNQVSPIPDYNYIYMINGDLSLGDFAFSRVYINFMNIEDIYNFKERFDNYIFLDNKGNEYPAVVEFAAFQKIPKKRGKARIDPKCGTIEVDPIYLEFVESLNKPPQEQDEKPEYTLQLSTQTEKKNDVTTPLLEYIKNKRAQRMRIREVRREERKRKDFDKRKERYDDKRKLIEKSPVKNVTIKTQNKSTSSMDKGEDIEEKSVEKIDKAFEKSSYYKNKERKHEDKKKGTQPRYARKDYDNRDYRRSEDYKDKEFRPKYDEKKDAIAKAAPKKVKKYSEKREERKIEAQKAEQKKMEAKESKENKTNESELKLDEKVNKNEEKCSSESSESFKGKINKTGNKLEVDFDSYSKESEMEKNQRRIRNKDRPTIAIYRPGMLSKRKQNPSDPKETETKDSKLNENE